MALFVMAYHTCNIITDQWPVCRTDGVFLLLLLPLLMLLMLRGLEVLLLMVQVTFCALFVQRASAASAGAGDMLLVLRVV